MPRIVDYSTLQGTAKREKAIQDIKDWLDLPDRKYQLILNTIKIGFSYYSTLKGFKHFYRSTRRIFSLKLGIEGYPFKALVRTAYLEKQAEQNQGTITDKNITQ